MLCFRIGKCYAHPTFRQELCAGCGEECDKCEFGVVISALCGIAECRRVSNNIDYHNCTIVCRIHFHKKNIILKKSCQTILGIGVQLQS